MQRLILLLLLMIFLGWPLETEAKTYRHYGHQFEFVVPDDWEVQENPGNGFLVVMVEPDLRYEVNAATVLYQKLPPSYTLTDYANNTVLNQSKMLWQYQLGSKELIDHPFGPCYRLEFTWRLSWEQQYYVNQIMISRYPDVYVVTTTVPIALKGAYEGTFAEIFDTFAFFN